MGRPKKIIDPEIVRKLALIQCTMIEIASVVGCSVDTLENRFSDIIKEGKEQGKTSLRRFQYLAAEKGNATMMIWLGKQYLGQSDKIEEKIEDVTKSGNIKTVFQIKWADETESNNASDAQANAATEKNQPI